MLNRRSLRVKVMQSLFAFQQCKEANYELSVDLVEHQFTPDLTSMEVQDKTELKKLEKEAVKLFETTFVKDKSSVKHENDKIKSSVKEGLTFYAKSTKKDFDFFKKNLVLEAEKIYDLYISVLGLFVTFAQVAEGDKKIDHSNFYNNQWIKAFRGSEQLRSELLKGKFQWDNRLGQVRAWLKDILRQDNEYMLYLDRKSPTVEDQKKIMNHLLRRVILGNTTISDAYEEDVLRWSEDREIVKGMVEKTIKAYDPESEAPLQLHTLSMNWEDDRDFIETLFSASVNLDGKYRELIAANTRNWEVERLPLTDRVILEMSIAELISFPNIPVKVTINEYIELSKNYSTPKSRQFINGILDVISKELKNQGDLKKSGRGLIDNK